jgi:hypothetical protein
MPIANPESVLGGNIEPVLQKSLSLAGYQPDDDPAVQPVQQAEAGSGQAQLQ